MGRIDLWVPFQRSASGMSLEPVMTSPTAVQAVPDGQDTPFSSLPCAPGWIDHWVPFQRSTSDAVTLGLLVMYHPTAVQADAELQETPSNWALMSGAGLGAAWVAQAVPFQYSASVRVTPDFAVYHPTALHREADEQDTPVSSLPCNPGWIAQRVPFYFSASGTDILPYWLVFFP